MAENKAGLLTKMTLFLEKYLMPIAGKIAEQKHLGAMRDGMRQCLYLLLDLRF